MDFTGWILLLATSACIQVDAAFFTIQDMNTEIDNVEQMLMTINTHDQFLKTFSTLFGDNCKNPSTRKFVDTYLTQTKLCIDDHINVQTIASDLRAAVPWNVSKVLKRICGVLNGKVNNCISKLKWETEDCVTEGQIFLSLIQDLISMSCGADNSGRAFQKFIEDSGAKYLGL